MSNRTRITADKFSFTLYAIAQSYGLNTVGKLSRFLEGCKPTAKLYVGVNHVRVAQVRKELRSYTVGR
jgi:hypothetical protein